ncbi:MAG: hypothetical protein JNK25_13165 [Phycisphaerae bacterium]|nr:hypothetical protein [Phycisphaerae bacterium]
MNIQTLLRNGAGAAPSTGTKRETNPLLTPEHVKQSGLKSLVEDSAQNKPGAATSRATKGHAVASRGPASASSHLVPQRTNSPSSGG